MKESMENYLEAILMLKEEIGNVRSIDIVNKMGFSKPSISVAVKKMRENNYITVDSDGYIFFTEKGKSVAESVLERHRSITYMLVKLGVPEEIAKQDACRIEHDISEETFQALKNHMNGVKPDRNK
ncbi:MAG: metal-dependent transcriptional regulator [Filifactoraceae bacterium]